MHRDFISFTQQGDFSTELPFCSQRKSCLPLQGVGKSHEGDGQRSHPHSQRVHSFWGYDVLLVKGQILSNKLKASTLWFCLCFDYQGIHYSIQSCTGLAGVLAGSCWEVPKVLRWDVCAAKVIWKGNSQVNWLTKDAAAAWVTALCSSQWNTLLCPCDKHTSVNAPRYLPFITAECVQASWPCQHTRHLRGLQPQHQGLSPGFVAAKC